MLLCRFQVNYGQFQAISGQIRVILVIFRQFTVNNQDFFSISTIFSKIKCLKVAENGDNFENFENGLFMPWASFYKILNISTIFSKKKPKNG